MKHQLSSACVDYILQNKYTRAVVSNFSNFILETGMLLYIRFSPVIRSKVPKLPLKSSQGSVGTVRLSMLLTSVIIHLPWGLELDQNLCGNDGSHQNHHSPTVISCNVCAQH